MNFAPQLAKANMAQFALWPATHFVWFAEQATGPSCLGFVTLVIHNVNFTRGETLTVPRDA